MLYSSTELEYLRQSLVSSPPVRPDSRPAGQFRPVETDVDLLPSTNGSSRVRTADGSECIVGIKARVVEPKNAAPASLVDVSVDIVGFKDNDAFPTSLAVVLKQTLQACPELIDRLQRGLGGRHAFRLFVDCVVLSYTSHPLSLVSLGVFQALRATRLPRPLDADAEEFDIPQFYDDWSLADPLCPSGWTPPVLFTVALVGSGTVLMDPTLAEEHVAEACLCITWKNSRVAAPIRTLDIGATAQAGTFVGAFSPALIYEAYDLVAECAPQVVAALA